MSQQDTAKFVKFAAQVDQEISRANEAVAYMKSHKIPHALLWPVGIRRSKLTEHNLISAPLLMHVDKTGDTPTGRFFLPLVSKDADNQLVFHIMQGTLDPVGEDEEDADVEPGFRYSRLIYVGDPQFSDNLLNEIRRQSRESLESKPFRQLVILSNHEGFSFHLVTPAEYSEIMREANDTVEADVNRRMFM